MALDHVFTLRLFSSPEPAPAVIHLQFQWKSCSHLSLEGPYSDFGFWLFDFRFHPYSEFRRRLLRSIAGFRFPVALYGSICGDLTYFFDALAESPTRHCPSLTLVVDITFVYRNLSLYRPPPPSPGIPSEENQIPEAPSEENFMFLIPRRPSEENVNPGTPSEEDSIPGTPTEEIFLPRTPSEESFVPGTAWEEGGESHSESQMEGRIERGRWAGEGGEVKCSICLDELSEGQETMTMACRHSYHDHCLLPWLSRNQSCPLCRRPIWGIH